MSEAHKYRALYDWVKANNHNRLERFINPIVQDTNNAFKVFPVPVEGDMLNVVINEVAANDFTRITITNIAEDIVHTQNVYGKSALISTAKLESGIYIVHLKNNLKTETNRIIIK
jgi:hypothetical protein